jgi:hypothetical protein
MRGENKSVVETLVLNSDFVLCNPLAGRDAPDREINFPGEDKPASCRPITSPA